MKCTLIRNNEQAGFSASQNYAITHHADFASLRFNINTDDWPSQDIRTLDEICSHGDGFDYTTILDLNVVTMAHGYEVILYTKEASDWTDTFIAESWDQFKDSEIDPHIRKLAEQNDARKGLLRDIKKLDPTALRVFITQLNNESESIYFGSVNGLQEWIAKEATARGGQKYLDTLRKLPSIEDQCTILGYAYNGPLGTKHWVAKTINHLSNQTEDNFESLLFEGLNEYLFGVPAGDEMMLRDLWVNGPLPVRYEG